MIVPAPVETVWQDWNQQGRDGVVLRARGEIDPRVGGAFHIHMIRTASPHEAPNDMRYMRCSRRSAELRLDAPPSLPAARQQRTFVVVRLFRSRRQVHPRHPAPGPLGRRGRVDKTYATSTAPGATCWPTLRSATRSGTRLTEWREQLQRAHAAPPE